MQNALLQGKTETESEFANRDSANHSNCVHN